MGRRLYYQDSYGHWRRARRAERMARRSGGSLVPARLAVAVLVVLAAIVVLASLVH